VASVETTTGRLARRWTGAIAFTLTLAFLVAILAVDRLSLVKTELLSGPCLFALLVGLAGYGARRRLPVAAASRASTWMQLHTTLGLVSIALFFVHTGGRLPTGVLERALALTFTTVTLTGVIGIWLSRSLLRRLSARGDDGAENIAVMRRRLLDRAEELVRRAGDESGSATLAELHASHLAPFLERPRHLLRHLLGSQRPRLRILIEVAARMRDATVAEREAAAEIGRLLRMKDDLDAQAALQLAQRGWLFLHVPLTWVLLVLAALHGLIARAYLGGPA